MAIAQAGGDFFRDLGFTGRDETRREFEARTGRTGIGGDGGGPGSVPGGGRPGGRDTPKKPVAPLAPGIFCPMTNVTDP